MIKPRYNPFLVWFFNRYTLYSIRWHFSKVTINGEFRDEGKPILMIGNHFSWWDGFMAHFLNMELLHRRFNVMMLERELKQRMFLNQIGAFSISKSPREIVTTLNFLKELLTDSQNLVVYYPQGKFQSLYDRPIRFQRGIERILEGVTDNDMQVFLYVALVDYLENKKPALTYYISSYPIKQGRDVRDIEGEYNALYMSALDNQTGAV